IAAVDTASSKSHGSLLGQNMVGGEFQPSLLPAAGVNTDVAIIAVKGGATGQLPDYATCGIAPVKSPLGALEYLDPFRVEQAAGALGRCALIGLVNIHRRGRRVVGIEVLKADSADNPHGQPLPPIVRK